MRAVRLAQQQPTFDVAEKVIAETKESRRILGIEHWMGIE
jgi:hypothetical protein